MRCVCLAFGSRHRGRRGANSEAAHGSETFRADASARARPATFNKYESDSLFFSSIARAALELAPELHLSLVLFD